MLKARQKKREIKCWGNVNSCAIWCNIQASLRNWMSIIGYSLLIKIYHHICRRTCACEGKDMLSSRKSRTGPEFTCWKSNSLLHPVLSGVLCMSDPQQPLHFCWKQTNKTILLSVAGSLCLPNVSLYAEVSYILAFASYLLQACQ